MPEYLISWEINIAANSPKEAAKQAKKYMPCPGSGSTATVFRVTDEDGESVNIDLTEED